MNNIEMNKQYIKSILKITIHPINKNDMYCIWKNCSHNNGMNNVPIHSHLQKATS